MKLTVLLDNNTLIGRYFLGEPGVSYLIEDGDKKILFDVGYSDAFIKNAQKLSVDLLDIDFVVLSHGHLDHTWGLVPLVQLYAESFFANRRIHKPTLVAHPLAFAAKTFGDIGQFGSLMTEDRLQYYFRVEPSSEPRWITERLVFLGEIERTNNFEAKTPFGKIEKHETKQDDHLLDDSALAYKSPAGLVIITGCSHSGICNIIEYAKKVCGEDRIVDSIGGFHLLNPPPEQLQGTIEYMKSLRPAAVHACHCTDLDSKIALAGAVNLKDVGVGLTLEY